MEHLLRSERELREGLEDTLSEQHPGTPRSTICARVNEFLSEHDWNDDLPELWKQRWRHDREAERAGM